MNHRSRNHVCVTVCQITSSDPAASHVSRVLTEVRCGLHSRPQHWWTQGWTWSGSAHNADNIMWVIVLVWYAKNHTNTLTPPGHLPGEESCEATQALFLLPHNVILRFSLYLIDILWLQILNLKKKNVTTLASPKSSNASLHRELEVPLNKALHRQLFPPSCARPTKHWPVAVSASAALLSFTPYAGISKLQRRRISLWLNRCIITVGMCLRSIFIY